MKPRKLRRIPAVESVLQALGDDVGLPRPLCVAVIRRELAAVRSAKSIPEPAQLLSRVRVALEHLRRSRLQPVINATGVVVHTNLGRAPLSAASVTALAEVAARYSNLEIDLVTGGRGSRGGYVEGALALLCGAEAATVVNNCAAALVLILRHFTSGDRKEVVISRGELVQIGGGFRIPDILETSGVSLCEVGTTNQTTLSDYARAIGRRTALILKVHRSNFFMGGFVHSPSTVELASLARKKRVPFVEDLGSGAMVPTEATAGLQHEPTPDEVLRRGVHLVCFSGDKLMGGPQAGIVAGKQRHVAALKRDPFFRALRCDKLILCALQATANQYLQGAARPDGSEAHIPVLNLLRTSIEDLRGRARAILTDLSELPVTITIARTTAKVGGGTLPQAALDSVGLDFRCRDVSAPELLARLRQTDPPVVAYVHAGQVRMDLRTVFPDQDALLVSALRQALASTGSTPA